MISAVPRHGLDIRRIEAARRLGLEARTFEDREAALAWLATLPGGTDLDRP